MAPHSPLNHDSFVGPLLIEDLKCFSPRDVPLYEQFFFVGMTRTNPVHSQFVSVLPLLLMVWHNSIPRH